MPSELKRLGVGEGKGPKRKSRCYYQKKRRKDVEQRGNHSLHDEPDLLCYR